MRRRSRLRYFNGKRAARSIKELFDSVVIALAACEKCGNGGEINVVYKLSTGIVAAERACCACDAYIVGKELAFGDFKADINTHVVGVVGSAYCSRENGYGTLFNREDPLGVVIGTEGVAELIVCKSRNCRVGNGCSYRICTGSSFTGVIRIPVAVFKNRVREDCFKLSLYLVVIVVCNKTLEEGGESLLEVLFAVDCRCSNGSYGELCSLYGIRNGEGRLLIVALCVLGCPDYIDRAFTGVFVAGAVGSVLEVEAAFGLFAVDAVSLERTEFERIRESLTVGKSNIYGQSTS